MIAIVAVALVGVGLFLAIAGWGSVQQLQALEAESHWTVGAFSAIPSSGSLTTAIATGSRLETQTPDRI